MSSNRVSPDSLLISSFLKIDKSLLIKYSMS